MNQSTDQELVVIKLTQTWAMQGGGAYNPGERAAFSRAVANEIIERGCGVEVTLQQDASVKAPQSPATDKMVASPERAKTRRVREVLHG